MGGRAIPPRRTQRCWRLWESYREMVWARRGTTTPYSMTTTGEKVRSKVGTAGLLRVTRTSRLTSRCLASTPGKLEYDEPGLTGQFVDGILFITNSTVFACYARFLCVLPVESRQARRWMTTMACRSLTTAGTTCEILELLEEVM